MPATTLGIGIVAGGIALAVAYTTHGLDALGLLIIGMISAYTALIRPPHRMAERLNAHREYSERTIDRCGHRETSERRGAIGQT